MFHKNPDTSKFELERSEHDEMQESIFNILDLLEITRGYCLYYSEKDKLGCLLSIIDCIKSESTKIADKF